MKADVLEIAQEVNKKTDVIKKALENGVLPTNSGDQFFYLIRASDVPPDIKLKFMGGAKGVKKIQQIMQKAQQYDPRTRLQKARDVYKNIKEKKLYSQKKAEENRAKAKTILDQLKLGLPDELNTSDQEKQENQDLKVKLEEALEAFPESKDKISVLLSNLREFEDKSDANLEEQEELNRKEIQAAEEEEKEEEINKGNIIRVCTKQFVDLSELSALLDICFRMIEILQVLGNIESFTPEEWQVSSLRRHGHMEGSKYDEISY